MPVSIPRIQINRGKEFIPTTSTPSLTDKLRSWSIKFRPIRPRSPHLNGKVERVQKTALEESWPAVDLKDPELEARLAEWQHFYIGNARTTASAGGLRSTVCAI